MLLRSSPETFEIFRLSSANNVYAALSWLVLVAQWFERRTSDQAVMGSIPDRGVI